LTVEQPPLSGSGNVVRGAVRAALLNAPRGAVSF
jgi:hypothetical protein